MKIAIVTPTFPPYAGGIGNVAAFNARELKKLGHQVTVFTPEYQVVKEEFTDLEVKRIKPLFKYGNAAFLPRLARLLKGFEIIHLHYPFFGAAEIIWLHNSKFKIKNSKLILHYHMDVVGEGLLKFVFNLHRLLLLPRIVKMADKVIFTSADYGQHSNLASLAKTDPAKFVEVPNGVDTNWFVPQPKDQVLLNKYQISPQEKIVLFVGGLDKAHYFKGVEYLIEAMSILKQANYSWRLVIVGAGELKNEYLDLAGQLNIDRKIVFSGYVPNKDLPKYYNLADVVVLPSIDKSEAFGLTLVEAMSCAKPVIASDLVGVRSVVDQEVNGLIVKPKNADDLATKINLLLSNAEMAKRYGEAGRTKAMEVYDWGIIGKKLDKLYQDLNLKRQIRNSKQQ